MGRLLRHPKITLLVAALATAASVALLATRFQVAANHVHRFTPDAPTRKLTRHLQGDADGPERGGRVWRRQTHADRFFAEGRSSGEGNLACQRGAGGPFPGSALV